MSILQSLPGHLSVVQSLISFLSNFSDVVFLITLETNFQIFGATGDRVSGPKYTERLHHLFRFELILRL